MSCRGLAVEPSIYVWRVLGSIRGVSDLRFFSFNVIIILSIIIILFSPIFAFV